MLHRGRLDAVEFRLADDLAHEVRSALVKIGAEIRATTCHSPEECIHQVRDERRDVVFCGHDPNAIRLLRDRCPAAAIVVVGRAAEVSDWLDALEAGADDYFAAPLDERQAAWIVQTVQTKRSAA